MMNLLNSIWLGGVGVCCVECGGVHPALEGEKLSAV